MVVGAGLVEILRPTSLVFAGGWAWYEVSGVRRRPVGFVGVLVDTWDEWAVFGCGRDVAEEVVDQHQRELLCEDDQLGAGGYGSVDLDERFRASTIAMWFDGDDIVVDERAFYADPTAIARLEANSQGLYVIRGYVWPWICVDPADCDRIAGSWPQR